jgi:hypothetical protein
MASLSEIQAIVQQIHQDLPALIQRARINPQQVVLIEGIADLSKRLGLIQAGEFRAGNDKEPGFGFTGGRFGYPGFDYGGTNYFLAGVSNDVLQVGMALASGKIIAGGGDIVLDADGLFIQNSTTSGLQFADDAGNRTTIHIVADANNDLEIVNIAQTPDGTISFFLRNDSGSTQRVLHMSQHISVADEFTILFEHGTNRGGRVSFGADHHIDFLQVDGTGSRTVVFNERGHDIDFRIEGATNPNVFVVDAGNDRVELRDAAGAAVHIINPTGTTYFNEPGNNVDFIIKDDGGNNIFATDADQGTATVIGDLHIQGNLILEAGSGFEGGVVAENNAESIFTVSSPGGPSLFTATINGAPSGTSVVYNAPSAGTEGVLVPSSTGQLAKMKLYNTTRGNEALISNCNTGTNTITLTANAPANWVNGDTITVTSQTVSGGGFNWVDLKITGGPTDKAALFINMVLASGTASDGMRVHPFSTFGGPKITQVLTQVGGVTNSTFCMVPISNNTFSFAWTANSTSIILREAGYIA